MRSDVGAVDHRAVAAGFLDVDGAPPAAPISTPNSSPWSAKLATPKEIVQRQGVHVEAAAGGAAEPLGDQKRAVLVELYPPPTP